MSMAEHETELKEAQNTPVVNTEKLNELQAELDAFKKELDGKVYPINVSGDIRDRIINFFEVELEWKYMEAYGATKVFDILKNADIKNDSIYVTSLEVEAIAFFLMKATGKGIKSAQNFMDLYKVSEKSLVLVKTDTDKLNSLMMNVAALAEGIDIDNKKEGENEKEPKD